MGEVVIVPSSEDVPSYCSGIIENTGGENFCRGYIHMELPNGEEYKLIVVAAIDDVNEGCGPFEYNYTGCLLGDEKKCKLIEKVLRLAQLEFIDPIVALICSQPRQLWYRNTPTHSVFVKIPEELVNEVKI